MMLGHACANVMFEVPCPILHRVCLPIFIIILRSLHASGYPGLPGISPRVAGPGGMVLDGMSFPEGMELGVPFWSLNRRPEYFDDPLAYRPERWVPVAQGGEGLQAGVGQAAAFTLFGQGRFTCLGHHLAMQEARSDPHSGSTNLAH